MTESLPCTQRSEFHPGQVRKFNKNIFLPGSRRDDGDDSFSSSYTWVKLEIPLQYVCCDGMIAICSWGVDVKTGGPHQIFITHIHILPQYNTYLLTYALHVILYMALRSVQKLKMGHSSASIFCIAVLKCLSCIRFILNYSLEYAVKKV